MRLSSYIVLRKIIAVDGRLAWFALWRGTKNRVLQANGQPVPCRTKQSELRFDLLNNPCENGVIA